MPFGHASLARIQRLHGLSKMDDFIGWNALARMSFMPFAERPHHANAFNHGILTEPVIADPLGRVSPVKRVVYAGYAVVTKPLGVGAEMGKPVLSSEFLRESRLPNARSSDD